MLAGVRRAGVWFLPWLTRARPGFGNFQPKNKPNLGPKPTGAAAEEGAAAGKAGEGKAGEGARGKEGARAEGKGEGKGEGKNKGDAEQPKRGEDDAFFSQVWKQTGGSGNGMAKVLALLLLMSLIPFPEVRPRKEISWQEFKTKLLQAGEVERIVVVNKSEARVILRKDAGEWRLLSAHAHALLVERHPPHPRAPRRPGSHRS